MSSPSSAGRVVRHTYGKRQAAPGPPSSNFTDITSETLYLPSPSESSNSTRWIPDYLLDSPEKAPSPGDQLAPAEGVSDAGDDLPIVSSQLDHHQTDEVESEDEGRIFVTPNAKASTEKLTVKSQTISSADPKRVTKQSDLRSFFSLQGVSKPKAQPKRRSLSTLDNQPSSKLASPSTSWPQNRLSTSNPPAKRQKLEQLHLVPVRLDGGSGAHSLHTTCNLCGMSYMRGGIGGDDELIHMKHCERVVEGAVWEGAGTKLGRTVRENVRFGGGSKGKGRVVCIEGRTVTNHAKVKEILDSIDIVLSSPCLPPDMLNKCKIFLFVTASSLPASPQYPLNKVPRPKAGKLATSNGKERVVAAVVAQPIKTALGVVRPGDRNPQNQEEALVTVETGDEEGSGSIVCWPERLPTKLGIHRIFTSPKYRRCGLSKTLLDVACEETIYGYTCLPNKGDVAFSQPTNSGKAVMDAWGKGKVRVFIEDEQEDK